jgi:hypothetical protein
MPETDPILLAERVKRGIARLEEYGYTDWWERIDLPSLDMADQFRCVLGQLFGNYGHGTVKLSLNGAGAVNCGFNSDVGSTVVWLANLDALRNLWVAEVESRAMQDARE